MLELRTTSEPGPPSTDRPLRQLLVFFATVMEGLAGVAIVSSAAAMAYATTETGLATMIIILGVAAFLLVREAADLDNARLAVQRPTMKSRVDAGRGQ